nr:unnamed protein product [Digitaria exilis]
MVAEGVHQAADRQPASVVVAVLPQVRYGSRGCDSVALLFHKKHTTSAMRTNLAAGLAGGTARTSKL